MAFGPSLIEHISKFLGIVGSASCCDYISITAQRCTIDNCIDIRINAGEFSCNCFIGAIQLRRSAYGSVME
jgi:hypothetical protein